MRPLAMSRWLSVLAAVTAFAEECHDTKKFRTSLNWSRLGHLHEAVLDRIAQQGEDVDVVKRRGIGSHVREELIGVGIPEDGINAVLNGLVEASTFIASVDFAKLGHLAATVSQRLAAQAEVGPTARRGVASQARQELRAAGVPEAGIASLLRGLVDESQFIATVDWPKLAQLEDTVLARLGEQGDQVAASERRGVASYVREALVEAGIPSEMIGAVQRGVVDESEFKPSINWTKVGNLKASVESSGTLDIAKLFRDGLRSAGVPDEEVHVVIEGLLDESRFKQTVDWTRLRQLKDTVLKRLDAQADGAERRGVAAHVRRELAAAGVAADVVRAMAQVFVQESRLKQSIDWPRFGDLKVAVLRRRDEQAHQVSPSAERGIAAFVRQELVAVGIPEELVRSMAQGLVHESKFKAMINWQQLADLQIFVLEDLEQESKKLPTSEQHGVAAHVRTALAEVGVPKDLVRPATIALVEESAFRTIVQWSELREVKARVIDRVDQDGSSLPLVLRQEFVRVGVPEAHVDAMVSVILQDCEQGSGGPSYLVVLVAIGAGVAALAGGGLCCASARAADRRYSSSIGVAASHQDIETPKNLASKLGLPVPEVPEATKDADAVSELAAASTASPGDCRSEYSGLS